MNRLNWKQQKPTEPGAYWVRGFNAWRPASRQFQALVQVRLYHFEDSDFGTELVCNLHQSTSEDDLRNWSPVADYNDKFEWAGPLVSPECEETCEAGAPECGPVEHHDSEGVPLCAVCWEGLLADSERI